MGVLCSSLAAAQTGTIRGIVRDAEDGESLAGASVYIKSGNFGAFTGMDGSFLLKNIPAGKHTISCSYTGYTIINQEVTVSAGGTVTVNFKLRSSAENLETIEVRANDDNKSDQSVRLREQKADNIINLVSQKSIALSPDLTVANVIMRVSGISVERSSNGDGQYAIVRGMDKRYNYTLINGVKIPSPDNQNRYIPLDMFPSEMLERLEVTKSLTPGMEGDAVGGVVNLIMMDAPAKQELSVNIASGFSELFMQRPYLSFDHTQINFQSPYEINGNRYNAVPSDFPSGTINYNEITPPPALLGGLSYGRRILKDKLGIMIAGTYQNTYRGSNSLFFEAEPVDTMAGLVIKKMRERRYSEQQTRYGIHGKFDFNISEKHKLRWYNAFINLRNLQTREELVTEFSFGYFPEIGNANIEYRTRSRLINQSITNSTLQGIHQFDNGIKLNWSAIYSFAKNEVPDQTLITIFGKQENWVQSMTTAKNQTRRWEHNEDRDYTGMFDLSYQIKPGGFPIDLTAGGLYRDKARSNFYNNYELRPVNVFARYGEDWFDLTEIQWRVNNPRGAVATSLTYDASENIKAGFFQFKFDVSKTQVLGGVRAENTIQGYEMRFPIGEDRPDGEQRYTDILPSIHFKHRYNSKTNFRASYFKSINRPGFFEIVPYKIVNEEFEERGNPDLKRARAHNFDFRYEYFPKAAEQILIGVFYKKIVDPIEYTLRRDERRGQDIFYSPGNFGTAYNYGIEIDYIKYFRVFGVKANYTYTNSSITTDKVKFVRDANGNIKAENVKQTRPLNGQSDHIFNLSALLKLTNIKLDGQIGFSYTGKRLNTVSQTLDNDFWQKGFWQMDASIDKGIGKHWIFYVKAQNLLNTPFIVFSKITNPVNDDIPKQDLDGKILIRRDYYGRIYFMGARYRLSK